jgi:hypothetical protein
MGLAVSVTGLDSVMQRDLGRASCGKSGCITLISKEVVSDPTTPPGCFGKEAASA